MQLHPHHHTTPASSWSTSPCTFSSCLCLRSSPASAPSSSLRCRLSVTVDTCPADHHTGQQQRKQVDGSSSRGESDNDVHGDFHICSCLNSAQGVQHTHLCCHRLLLLCLLAAGSLDSSADVLRNLREEMSVGVSSNAICTCLHCSHMLIAASHDREVLWAMQLHVIVAWYHVYEKASVSSRKSDHHTCWGSSCSCLYCCSK